MHSASCPDTNGIFFCNDTATTEIYTLSLHDALPISAAVAGTVALGGCAAGQVAQTAYQANSSTGATVTTNGIAVRDAQIAYPETSGGPETAAVYAAGGTAPVEMHVV